MAAYLNHTLVFALLSVLLFSCCESRARPRSLEDLDRLKVLDEIRDLSSVITLIDIPEDNTPKGPEDEDDSGSGTENTENAQCRGLFNNIQEVNASANGTKDAPDLIHANYDTLCDKTDSDKIKKLPVYIVGWELKEHCGEVNTIPFKRFRLDEYHAKKPRFDIPGMCIPMKGKEMTLLMVDPDAPSKKSHRCRSWLHWLVVNIPRGNLAQGKEIITYKPPAPPLHSGAHRYFFLLYEQNHHIQDIDDSDNNLAERCGFNVRTFAEDNSLVGPIALNMFLTERKRMKQDDDEENSKDKEKKEKEKEDKDKKDKKDKEDKEKEEQKGKGNQKKAETDNSKEEQKKAGDEKKVEQNDNVDAKNKEQQNSGEQTKAKEKQDTKDNEKSESKVRNDNKQKEGEQKKNVTSSKEEHANKDAQNKKEGENNKGAQRDKIDATASEEQKNIPVTKETQEQKNKEVKLGTVDAKNNQIQNNNVQQKNETKTQGTQEQKINEVLTAKMDGNNNGNQVNKVDQNNKTTKNDLKEQKINNEQKIVNN